MNLFHIYTSGRFGPELHFGFVIADNEECFNYSTYICFDIMKSTSIPNGFFTNPKSIGNINNYRKWKKSIDGPNVNAPVGDGITPYT